jgi:hypothetical protein
MMNEPLSTLHDIHLPIALLPLQLMAGALLIFILLIRRWYIGRKPLRMALRQLAASMSVYAQYNDDAQLILSLSQLLRRFAHSRWPHVNIVALYGADWLAFLESKGAKGDFINGAGAVLAWRGYSTTGKIDAPALEALISRWLKANIA